MKVSFNEKQLFDSSTFLTLDGEDAVVTVGEGQETLTFKLLFKEKKNAKEGIDTNVVDEKTLELKLVNWGHSLGNALISPIEIGQIGGQKAFINLFVKSTGSKSTVREVTFSVYLGERVVDG